MKMPSPLAGPRFAFSFIGIFISTSAGSIGASPAGVKKKIPIFLLLSVSLDGIKSCGRTALSCPALLTFAARLHAPVRHDKFLDSLPFLCYTPIAKLGDMP
ncbi:MAG TPA: hypothetical protein VM219_09100 [Phycisphaerae bacterium]|nr:hypothetical protein [Phycisphaerae bacterium]